MKNLFENWRKFTETLDLLSETEIGAAPWSMMPKDEVLLFLKDIGKGTSFRDLIGRLLTYGGKDFDVEYAITVIERLVEDGYLTIDKSPGTSYVPGQYPKQDFPEQQRWKVKTTKKLKKYLEKPWKSSWSEDRGPRKRRRRKVRIPRSELLKLDLNLGDTEKEFFEKLVPTAEDYKQVLKNAPGGGEWIPANKAAGQRQAPKAMYAGGGQRSQDILNDLVLKLSGDTGTYNPANGDMLFWDRTTARLAVVKTHPEIRGIIRLPEEITWNPRSSNSLIVRDPTTMAGIPIELDDLTSNPLLNWNPEYIPKEHNRFWTGRNARIRPPQMRLPVGPGELEPSDEWAAKRPRIPIVEPPPNLPEVPLPDEAKQMAVDAGWKPEPPEGETPENKAERLKDNRNHPDRTVREYQILEDAREQAKLNDPARNPLFDDNLDEKDKKFKRKRLDEKVRELNKRNLNPEDLAAAIDEAELETNRKVLVRRAARDAKVAEAARIAAMSPGDRLARTGVQTLKVFGGLIAIFGIIVLILFIWAIFDISGMRKFLGWLGIEEGSDSILNAFLDWVFRTPKDEASWRDRARERGVTIPTDFEGAKVLMIKEMHPEQLKDLIKISGIGVFNTLNPLDPVGAIDTVLFEQWNVTWEYWNTQIGLPFEEKVKGRLGDHLRKGALHYLCMQKTYGLNASGPEAKPWDPEDPKQDWKGRLLGYRKKSLGKWTIDYDNPVRGEKEYRYLMRQGFWISKNDQPEDPCAELAAELDWSGKEKQQRNEAEKWAFKELTGMEYSNENLERILKDPSTTGVEKRKFLDKFTDLINQYITRSGGTPQSQFTGGAREPERMTTLPPAKPIQEAKQIKLKIIKEQAHIKNISKENNIKQIKLKILKESKK